MSKTITVKNRDLAGIRAAIGTLSGEPPQGVSKKDYDIPKEPNWLLAQNLQSVNRALEPCDAVVKKHQDEFRAKKDEINKKIASEPDDQKKAKLQSELSIAENEANQQIDFAFDQEVEFDSCPLTRKQIEEIDPVPSPALITRLSLLIKEK